MSNDRVGTLSIGSLMEQKLIIPSYQRPYTWSEKQVIALIEDIIEAFNNKNEHYLLGNMIFYKKKEKLEIVDGQQRSITLGLMLKVLGYKVLDNNEENNILKQEISKLSYKAIKDNYNLIRNKLNNYCKKNELKNFILDKCQITFITTNTQDEAFILFDSQNTRGKPLKRKDLLKVHHIRFIDRYETQKELAKQWEKITYTKNDSMLDDIDKILENLAIIRKAVRGEIEGNDLVYIDVFQEFIAEKFDKKLNNYNQPPIFESFSYDVQKDELLLNSKSIDIRGLFRIGSAKEYLPFETTQSISAGEEFFWYILKYHALYKKLCKNEIFVLLDNVYGSGNIYLRKIYSSLILYFVDKFGFDYLEEFAIGVYTILLDQRLNGSSVRKEGVVNNNLFLYKIVLLKYSPSIVIKEINRYIDFEIGVLEKPENGVKANFYEPFRNYEEKIRINWSKSNEQ